MSDKAEKEAKEVIRRMFEECEKLISDGPSDEEIARIAQERAASLAAMIMPGGEPLEQISLPDGTMTCERHEPVEFTVGPLYGLQWCPNCLSMHSADGKHYFGKVSFDKDGGLLYQPIRPLNYVSMTLTLEKGSYDPGGPFGKEN